VQHIPYRGTVPAMTDVMSGQISSMFGTALSTRPQIAAGTVRALGLSSKKRSEAMPDVLPIAEVGVPGYEATQWYGLLAPAGTPPDIIARIHAEAAKALKSKDLLDKLATDGAEPVASTPEEFAQHAQVEFTKWAKVIKASNIKAE